MLKLRFEWSNNNLPGEVRDDGEWIDYGDTETGGNAFTCGMICCGFNDNVTGYAGSLE